MLNEQEARESIIIALDMGEEEAIALCDLFKGMITGDEKDVDLLEEELDEAAMLKDVSHMPARVKCAELAWRTLSEMLKEGSAGTTTTE